MMVIETERLLKRERVTIGTCGLIRRPGLHGVDIGFAFLPAFRGSGFAHEAAVAILESAKREHGLSRVLAIVLPENRDSVRRLESVGFTFDNEVLLPGDAVPLPCYSKDL